MKNKKLRRYEYNPTAGKNLSDDNFEKMLDQFMFALSMNQCPNCQSRVRFDYTSESLKITCPKNDYYTEMSAPMLLSIGHFLISHSEDVTLLNRITEILNEIKLQNRGHSRY